MCDQGDTDAGFDRISESDRGRDREREKIILPAYVDKGQAERDTLATNDIT